MEEQDDEKKAAKLTMFLSRQTVENLEAAEVMTGSTKRTCIVTAISLYRELLEEQKKKGRILIQDKHGDLTRITIL